MIEKYINKLNLKNLTEVVKEDLKFFLGAFLYPKQMKKLITEKQKLSAIENIHNCLYSFSICKLEYLSEFPSYKYILNYFIKTFKEKVMKTNHTMNNAKPDFN